MQQPGPLNGPSGPQAVPGPGRDNSSPFVAWLSAASATPGTMPARQPPIPPGGSPQGSTNSSVNTQANPTMNIAGDDYAQGEEGIVLTPSRLRTSSLSVLGYALGIALAGVFGALLYIKLSDALDLSWWLVFAPLISALMLQIPINAFLIWHMDASVGMHLQYELILSCRTRTHIMDCVGSAVESAAWVLVQLIFIWAVDTDRLRFNSGKERMPTSAILAPAWSAWVLILMLNAMKDAHERNFITLRDMMYAFTIVVALKADGVLEMSWNLVFALPWMYMAAALLLGVIMLCTLLMAAAWRRWHELLLPIGFCGFLISHVPLLAAISGLSDILDMPGSASVSNAVLPFIVACVLMAGSAGVVMWGMLLKERLRDRLIATGAVWTAFEAMARRMGGEREEAQRLVDAMPEDQVKMLVQQQLAGKQVPEYLLRVGPTLYKRSEAPDQEVANATLPTATSLPTSKEALPASKPGPKSMNDNPQSPAQNGGLIRTAPDLSDPQSAPDNPSMEAGGGQPGVTASPGTAADPPAPHVALELPQLQRGGQSTVMQSTPGDMRPALVTRSGGGGGVVDSGGASSSRDRPSSARPSGRSERLIAGRPPRGPGAARPGQEERASLPLPGAPRRQRTTGGGSAGAATTSGGGFLDNSVLAQLVNGQLFGIGVPTQVAAEDAEEDDDTCVICCDATATSVFLECGHGGFCTRCARLIFVRPPNECPACRQQLSVLAELESVVPVGRVARVRPLPPLPSVEVAVLPSVEVGPSIAQAQQPLPAFIVVHQQWAGLANMARPQQMAPRVPAPLARPLMDR